MYFRPVNVSDTTWSYRILHTKGVCFQRYISNLISFPITLRWFLKHSRIFYWPLRFTFALQRVHEIQSRLTVSHLIIFGILQLCHTSAFCIVLLFRWTSTEAAYRKNISLRYRVLPVSCPHPDLTVQWQSQRHTLQMLTLSCSFFSFFFPLYDAWFLIAWAGAQHQGCHTAKAQSHPLLR